MVARGVPMSWRSAFGKAWCMPSPRLLIGRHSVVGAVYAVTTVVAGRRPVFADAEAAETVVDELRLAGRMGMVVPLAWVVMPDHLHWLFELRAPSLAQVVGRMKSCSARRVQALGGGEGALWQTGYYDHRLRRDEDVVQQGHYILGNPVRAGLAEEIGVYPYAWCAYPL